MLVALADQHATAGQLAPRLDRIAHDEVQAVVDIGLPRRMGGWRPEVVGWERAIGY